MAILVFDANYRLLLLTAKFSKISKTGIYSPALSDTSSLQAKALVRCFALLDTRHIEKEHLQPKLVAGVCETNMAARISQECAHLSTPPYLPDGHSLRMYSEACQSLPA